jgi:glycosyltransferase involved in cell wall biosynthesis
MITVLSVVDEFHVVDFGSTDGTLEILREIAAKNPRIKVHQRTWTKTNDSSTFADAANECCAICPTDHVLFYQADEVFHENLMRKIKEKYINGEYNLNFERIQLSHGMHVVKWLPHACVRSIDKRKYKYANDGMTVGDSGGTFMMCRNPLTGVFGNSRQFPWHQPKPGLEFDGKNPTALNAVMAEVFPWDEFLVDTSSSFRDNQAGKKELHAPFWRETANIQPGMKNEEWLRREKMNSLWERKEPSFPLPKIIQGLVGMTSYSLRPEIREALEKDSYEAVMGIKV